MASSESGQVNIFYNYILSKKSKTWHLYKNSFPKILSQRNLFYIFFPERILKSWLIETGICNIIFLPINNESSIFSRPSINMIIFIPYLAYQLYSWRRLFIFLNLSCKILLYYHTKAALKHKTTKWDLKTLLIGILLLKHVFHTSVKDLDYFCFKTLHINVRNNKSLTCPVFADSKSKMLSKYLQFYLKHLKQNFITNTKTPRIAAIVGTDLRESIQVL